MPVSVIKAVLISLKTLIHELEEDKELKPLLSSFLCSQDELAAKSITELTVYGYISLVLKILTAPVKVSNFRSLALKYCIWKLIMLQ